MSLDLQQLRQVTVDAKAEQEREKLRLQAQKLQEQQLQRQAEKTKADGIILQIEARAFQEAQAGRNFAIVMSIDHGDFYIPGRDIYNICEPQWLTGAARLVYEYCVAQQLSPTIERWDDGVGIQGGFNILIHW